MHGPHITGSANNLLTPKRWSRSTTLGYGGFGVVPAFEVGNEVIASSATLHPILLSQQQGSVSVRQMTWIAISFLARKRLVKKMLLSIPHP